MQGEEQCLQSIGRKHMEKDKETLSRPYKAISWPVALYAAPIYAPLAARHKLEFPTTCPECNT